MGGKQEYMCPHYKNHGSIAAMLPDERNNLNNDNTLTKTKMRSYTRPMLHVVETQTCNIVAASLPINNEETVNAGNALMKENTGWDIWQGK